MWSPGASGAPSGRIDIGRLPQLAEIEFQPVGLQVQLSYHIRGTPFGSYPGHLGAILGAILVTSGPIWEPQLAEIEFQPVGLQVHLSFYIRGTPFGTYPGHLGPILEAILVTLGQLLNFLMFNNFRGC